MIDPGMTQKLEEGLHRTLKAFRRTMVVEGQARELTQAQFMALRHLVDQGEARMSDLACKLELTNSATTGLIERLDARGLVRRRPDPEDGRGVRVAITEAGRALEAEMKAQIWARLGKAFERLSEPERHMAVGGVLALAASLEALDAP